MRRVRRRQGDSVFLTLLTDAQGDGYDEVLGVSLSIIAIAWSISWAGERKPIKISARDKCPVCGMFVAKYPDWAAQIIFKDGSYAVFDGPKDMFNIFLT